MKEPDFDFRVKVRTPGTNNNGEGQPKWGDWETLIAPEGYLFNQLVVEKEGWEIIESRGRDNYPGFEWHDEKPYVKGDPTVKFPSKMKARAHAKSPGGVWNRGESGMSNIRIYGNYIKQIEI